jgi:hypothetical protein
MLKENHTFTNQLEVEQVRKMELPTPEDRWPEDNIESREVYKKGTKQECKDFIKNNFEGDDLRDQFEIKKF